ncbi:MAG: long-chain fatty acid--CoA ligase [Geodermatophilaceae bacterium]|nr:long-chain fatty acid--CoA ligase [Geodermatophilaceae bacterium]
MGQLVTSLITAAHKHPDRPAVRLEESVLSYRGLLDAAERVAGMLKARGLEPGDRICLVLPNVPAFPVLFYGSLIAGCIVLPLNPLLRHREIEYCLQDSGAKLVFASENAGDAAVAAAQAAGAECMLVDAVGPSSEQLADAPNGTEPVQVADDDTAVLLYTSWVSGKPRGAMLTHANLSSNAATSAIMIKCTSADVVMGCLPLFHLFGLTGGLNLAVFAGACLTLMPRFHPTKALEIIDRDRVTIFEGVPTMYSAMVTAPNRDSVDTSTLLTCITGGSPMPVDVMKSFEQAFGCIVLEGYGLSETSPVASFNHMDAERKPGSIGTPIAGMQLKLIGEDGNDIPEGSEQIGEIAIRGDGVMKGYWQHPEDTEKIITDGWLRTGDLATRDRDGYYFIVDRKKDLIIRGGYNVYPGEIEDALREHEAVAAAAVIGIEHPHLGEEVGAAVVLVADAQVTVAELRNFVKLRVAAYKYPRLIWIVDDLPRGPTGQIARRQVSPPPRAPESANQ